MGWKNFVPHFHSYRAIAVNHYIDTTWGGRANSTNVTKQCEFCGHTKTEMMFNAGFIPLETFNQKSAPKVKVIKQRNNIFTFPKLKK